MRTIETTGTVDSQGHIQLDMPQPQVAASRVRVVMLLDEPAGATPSSPIPKSQSQRRIPGQDQGKVWIADDFNELLPEAVLNDFLSPL